MAYIISSIMRKAFEKHEKIAQEHTISDLWKYLMLMPSDYSQNALFSDVTRTLMKTVEFEHGGDEYDSQYPKGIPTSISISTANGKQYDSGLVLFPGGHAANETVDLVGILEHKFVRLGQLALEQEDLIEFVSNLENISELNNEQLSNLYDCDIKYSDRPIDQNADDE